MQLKRNHLMQDIFEACITHVDAGWAKFELKFTHDIPCAPDECAGYTDLNTYTIYVDDRLSNEYFREVLLHEITHLMMEISGYTNPDENKEFNPTNEELTTNLSRSLLLLIRLNPELFKILVDTQ
jgi:hypothetical protein